MKDAAGRFDFERAAQLRDSLEALNHIREPVTFRSLKEEDVKGRLESSRALQELQTGLGLAPSADANRVFRYFPHSRGGDGGVDGVF
jgi:hypothetical protein